MVEGVVSGAIDAIATDHAPHPGSEKMQEFEKCPFGIIGLETALGVALEQLVHPGKIGLPRMVELFTTGPARILGIDRGTLAPGAAGDVTIFSTDREWTYDVNRSFSKSRNSPFDGNTLPRRPSGDDGGRRDRLARLRFFHGARLGKHCRFAWRAPSFWRSGRQDRIRQCGSRRRALCLVVGEKEIENAIELVPRLSPRLGVGQERFVSARIRLCNRSLL